MTSAQRSPKSAALPPRPGVRKLLRMCGFKDKVREDTLEKHRKAGVDEFASARAAMLESAGLDSGTALRLAQDKPALYRMMDTALRYKPAQRAESEFERSLREYGASDGTGKESGTQRLPPPAPKPHESLEFPPDAIVAMIAEGVHPEDVRRVLVYGLKLHSNKRAVGAKYFESVYFNECAERSLESGQDEPSARVKEIREFLLRNGVIAYYKRGDCIRLNLQKEYQRGAVTELGSMILDSTVAWMHEFQEATAA